jgi:hypothetical protein
MTGPVAEMSHGSPETTCIFGVRELPAVVRMEWRAVMAPE